MPLAGFVYLLTLVLNDCSLAAAGNKCELKGCPKLKSGYINVHAICHSHNDAGWLDSVDAIYTTTVREIYATVVEALQLGSDRRYVSAENVFFSRWWSEQSAAVRRRVHELVQSGHLQFVGGGWVQNDEAVTHYTAIIDQMTLGLRFLNETFGPDCGVPSVAWQADPFGHSLSQAALFARMGFSGMMVGRVSMDTLKDWKASHHMGFVWNTRQQQEGRQNRSGDNDELFTWVPWSSYSTPHELCYESCLKDETTVPLTTPTFVLGHARDLEEAYGGKVVPLMLGDDLAWVKAIDQYGDVDDLLHKANRMGSWPLYLLLALATGRSHRPVRIVYSTPACYMQALRATASQPWPRFEDDLLPYSDRTNHTWSGYYTTRPSIKMMARYSNGFVQACKQLSVLGPGVEVTKVRALQEAVAVLQHHDAIT
ncbi:lysosomal alpha-mannosidase-like [Amblyomma americanum]